MKLRTFPIGAFPDIASDSGLTNLAVFQPGRGVVVWQWADGNGPEAEAFVDSRAQTNGMPMCRFVDGDLALVYRIDSPERVATASQNWTIPTALQWPVILGEDGRIAAIKFVGGEPRIVVGRWPHEPTQDVGRCGSSQGLSHFQGDTVIDRDQARVPFNPNFQNGVFIEGAAVGVTGDDRLVVQLGNVIGTLPSVGRVKDPRLTRQQNGALAICWWFDGQPIGVAVDVVATDLVPLTVDPPDPPDPIDPPPDDPMPTDTQIAALHASLKTERAKYPATITKEQCGLILNAACWRVRADGWGLSTKPAGNNVPAPQGVTVSYDALHHKPSDTIWDCATGESTTMTIVAPHQTTHHNDPNRPWLAPIEPADTPDPPDPVDPPPTFDKEKAKEPSIKAAAEFVSPVIGIPIPDAGQGCREMWDKYPPAYLPSVQELACGATWRSGCSPVADELINEHITKAIAETQAIRALSGYACGPASGGGGGGSAIERVRVNGLRWETVSGKPWQWRGCTSFDLPFHIGKHGNAAWADYLASERFTIARIVPATLYRNPRTLSEGVVWLPKTLDALKARGLWAEVTILVDTGPGNDQYDLDADEMRAYVAEIGAILSDYDNVSGAELANENGHQQNQNHALLTDPSFLAELRELIPSNVMCSWGSHGGDQPQIDGGEYITWHANRGRTPEFNAQTMGDWQAMRQIPVVDDEPLGIAELASSSRTNDPTYGERCARANRQHGVAASTLHLDAGLTSDVSKLGAIQREAVQRFIRAMVNV